MPRSQDVEAQGLRAGQCHICGCFTLKLLIPFVSQSLIRVRSAQNQRLRTKTELMKRTLTLTVRFH